MAYCQKKKSVSRMELSKRRTENDSVFEARCLTGRVQHVKGKTSDVSDNCPGHALCQKLWASRGFARTRGIASRLNDVSSKFSYPQIRDGARHHCARDHVYIYRSSLRQRLVTSPQLKLPHKLQLPIHASVSLPVPHPWQPQNFAVRRN